MCKRYAIKIILVEILKHYLNSIEIYTSLNYRPDKRLLQIPERDALKVDENRAKLEILMTDPWRFRMNQLASFVFSV